MSKRQYMVLATILLLVTNLTTASVVYGLLYSVPAAAHIESSRTALFEPVLPKTEMQLPVRTELIVSAPRDPLRILDGDDLPGPSASYESSWLKSNWQLAGIMRIHVDGSPEGEVVMVCHFKEKPRYYREGDRLDGTHFTVDRLCNENDQVYVDVVSGSGYRVRLHLLGQDRYK